MIFYFFLSPTITVWLCLTHCIVWFKYIIKPVWRALSDLLIKMSAIRRRLYVKVWFEHNLKDIILTLIFIKMQINIYWCKVVGQWSKNRWSCVRCSVWPKPIMPTTNPKLKAKPKCIVVNEWRGRWNVRKPKPSLSKPKAKHYILPKIMERNQRRYLKLYNKYKIILLLDLIYI